jgi:hypothetical protein
VLKSLQLNGQTALTGINEGLQELNEYKRVVLVDIGLRRVRTQRLEMRALMEITP